MATGFQAAVKAAAKVRVGQAINAKGDVLTVEWKKNYQSRNGMCSVFTFARPQGMRQSDINTVISSFIKKEDLMNTKFDNNKVEISVANPRSYFKEVAPSC